jgi:hypothetical protein
MMSLFRIMRALGVYLSLIFLLKSLMIPSTDCELPSPEVEDIECMLELLCRRLSLLSMLS